MKFFVVLQEWESGMKYSGRTVEADGAIVFDTGILGFFIGGEGNSEQAAWIAPDVWKVVLKLSDDGTPIMKDLI